MRERFKLRIGLLDSFGPDSAERIGRKLSLSCDYGCRPVSLAWFNPGR
jgi:hypothetical protein